MAMVACNTMRHGMAAGLLTVVGVELGDGCLLGATFAGLVLSGGLLPAVFRWLSLAGALYLVWLAAEALFVRCRRSRKATASRCRKPLLDGLTIAFANPAALVFYTAFFPQFIDRNNPIAGQMILLSAIYICAAVALDSACVLTVARVRLPAGWTQIRRFAELGSAAVYLSIAVVSVLSFIDASA
jgi:threonine/homoserine/homoserine lactone efflux protein